jgi:type II secretory pathway pseudopilin PulG
LLVVVILGVLAAVGIPKFSGSKTEAWVQTCLVNRSALEDAAARYRLDVNSYPADQAVLYATAAPVDVSGWRGPYIKKEFVCPATNLNTYLFDPDSGEITCQNITDGVHGER